MTPSSPTAPATNRSAAIRRATLVDAPVLAKLSATTFTETFGHLYPPADMQEYLERVCAPAACAKNLADERNGIWLASLGDDVDPIGYIAVGHCKLPVAGLEPQAGEIKQLYILEKHHNLKIGARLMDVALDWLEREHFSPLYIGVWSENLGAQRFYQRYGFEKVGEYGFPVGDTVDAEFILKRADHVRSTR